MPARKRHAAADHFSRLLERFTRQLKKTFRDPNADAIHDLRVAIRRFDRLLSTFREWFDPRKLQTARRSLKSLFRRAGAVRDCDIVIELLAKSGSGDVAKVADEVHLRRQRALRSLTVSMRSMLRHDWPGRWRSELAMQPPPEQEELSWEEIARPKLPERARDFFRLGERARKESSAAGLHEFRIAAKKFRYTFELFESAYGPTAESRLENLRAIQSVLGDINDLRTARKMLDELRAGKRIDSRLRKKQHKLVAEFHSLWEAQFPPTEIREWTDFFQRPPRKPVARAEYTAPQAIAAR